MLVNLSLAQIGFIIKCLLEEYSIGDERYQLAYELFRSVAETISDDIFSQWVDEFCLNDAF